VPKKDIRSLGESPKPYEAWMNIIEYVFGSSRMIEFRYLTTLGYARPSQVRKAILAADKEKGLKL